jgi:hypothetical protein
MYAKKEICVGVFLIAAVLPAGGASRPGDDFERRLKEVSAAVLAGTRTNAEKAAAFHKAAIDAKDDKRMQAALLQRAFEHGLAGVPDKMCGEVADEARDELDEVAPDQADAWRSKRIELRRLWFRRTTDRNQKRRLAAMLLEALLADADACEAEDNWERSVEVLAKARRLAAARQPDAKETADRYARAKHFAAVQQRIAGLKRLLAASAQDVVARRQLVAALVVDFDAPDEAVAYLNEQVAETWRTYVPLAAKPVPELPAAACKELGDWYHRELLKAAASPYSRGIGLSRAEAYYARVLALGEKAAALVVKVALTKVREDLAALPEAARSPRVAAGAYADLPAEPVELSVRNPWPFRMRVRKGQKLRIRAQGRWRIFPGGRWHGPGHRQFFLRGRLGSGQPFRVGADCTLEIQADGVLYLGMHEGGRYNNNSGRIVVTIEAAN